MAKPAARVKPTPAATKAAVEAAAPPPKATAEDKQDKVLMIDELIDVCRTHDAKFATQGAKEDDGTYVRRIITVVAEVTDEVFESMTAETKAWYNAAGEAINEGTTFPMPEGFESKFGAKPAADAKGAKPAAAPKAPKAPPPPRGPGKTARVRELVAANPAWKLEELEAALKKEGLDIKKATSSTIRSDVLATITAAKKMGVWGGK